MPRPAKHPDDRVRRNKEGYDEDGFRISTQGGRAATQNDFILPEWDGIRRGERLPSHPNDANGWHPQTCTWWEYWRESPQAMFFDELDWQYLIATAIIHDRIMKGVSHTALVGLTGELRKREGSFGASIEDRIRLSMSRESEQPVVDAASEKAITTAARATVNYFDRLNKKVAETIVERDQNKDNPGG